MINVKENIKIGIASLFITYTLYEKFMMPELQIPMIVSLLFIATFFVVKEVKKRIKKISTQYYIIYTFFSFYDCWR